VGITLYKTIPKNAISTSHGRSYKWETKEFSNIQLCFEFKSYSNEKKLMSGKISLKV
jgi:hypothetical protein